MRPGERAAREAFVDEAGRVLFAGAEEVADTDVIIVTYNSSKHINELIGSLRMEATNLRMRVLLADNDSSDGTLALVRTVHPDVISFSTGGNFGYSAGINESVRRAGRSSAVLVLNPDLTVAPGAIESMFRVLQHPHVGAVVPRLLDDEGSTSTSLHREPTFLRATGDALFGRRLVQRPGWLAGCELEPEMYERAHAVHWATGAAVMMRREIADELPWDEAFFLYSEETDFFRRLRESGRSVRYEPSAVMTHSGRGSGESAELNALMAVNRIRYIRKHRSPAYASVFRSAVVLAEILRAWKPGREGVLHTVLSESSWTGLPGPARRKTREEALASGSVIIPAHNEASVIARILAPIAQLAADQTIEVLVTCNGCTDRTAEIARSFAGVKVLELPTPSKAAALNAGDTAASRWPRLYLDADLEITADAVLGVFYALTSSGALAVRPAVRYDLCGAHPVIRSYYRTRQQLPSIRSGLWAAGAYGLSRKGHERFTAFPALMGDDLFIDRLFEPAEKAVLDVDPVVFRPPRNLRDLLAVLHRVNRGNAEQNGPGGAGSTAWNTLAEVLRSIRGPISAVHAVVYLFVAAAGRSHRSATGIWERDESSRQPLANERSSR